MYKSKILNVVVFRKTCGQYRLGVAKMLDLLADGSNDAGQVGCGGLEPKRGVR